MDGEHAISPGDVLAGKYRVERVLGEGGMGVVVAAHHLQLDQKVALKFLLPVALTSPDSAARFLREARAVARIRSEHVARVIDFGQLENGSPYIVMEYLEGSDLSVWLEQRGSLPVAQAIDFVLQSCEAIAEAHALGIIHRDLKPANLFCIRRSDGRFSIKVLDFGISKVTLGEASGHDITQTNALMGSPAYMSPEQMMRSKGVDARADIWSLGVILFQLLTGRLPFLAQAVTELAIKVANEPAPPLRTLRPESPERLEQVVARCLEKDRTARFQTVGELAIALREFGSEYAARSVEQIVGTLHSAGMMPGQPSQENRQPPLPSPSPAAGKTPPTNASWGDTAADSSAPRRRTRRAATIAAMAAGALLVSLLVAAVTRFSREPSNAMVTPASITTVAATSVPHAPVASAIPPRLDVADAAPTASLSAEVPTPSAVTPPTARTSRPPPTTRAAASASATAAPVPKTVDCDPPFYVNEKGSRVYKKECL
jgi:serine/threonine-protein kinase